MGVEGKGLKELRVKLRNIVSLPKCCLNNLRLLLSNMLLEQEEELLTTTPYENYLNSGGRLPEQEYDLASQILSYFGNEIPYDLIPSRNASVSQVSTICSRCELEPSLSEKYIYYIFRDRMNCNGKVSEQTDIRSKSTLCMSDQELLREIVLLTDESGEKYRIITETYPNIFSD